MIGFRSLLEFTFIGNLRARKKAMSAKSVLKDVDFQPIESYWASASESRNSDTKPSVLVDSLIFHPSYNEKNFLTAKLIQHVIGGELIALVQHSFSKSVIEFSRKFGINSHVPIYKFLSTLDLLRSIFLFVRSKGISTFSSTEGFRFVLHGIDVGGLIYDEYLRRNNLHTYRKRSLDFILFTIRSTYLYCRYSRILSKAGVTDIVIGHNVYAFWGLLIVAASRQKRNITIWNWSNYGENHMSIIRFKACYPILKPNYLEENVFKKVVGYFENEGLKIEMVFNSVVRRKYQGFYQDRDSSNVYDDIVVKSVSDFRNLNHVDENKYNVVIFAHSFVDAVKYARWSVFADYYTWLEETLRYLILNRSDCNLYVKIHPSEESYPCKMKAKELVKVLNLQLGANIVLLDHTYDNLVLFEVADVVVTSNGSVSVEAPAFGTKVIAAGECFTEVCGGIIQSRNIKDYYRNLSSFHVHELDLDTIRRSQYGFIWFFLMTRVSVPLTVAAIDKELQERQELTIALKKIVNQYEISNQFSIDTLEVIKQLKKSIESSDVNMFNPKELDEVFN